MTGITGVGNLNELQVARPVKDSRGLPAVETATAKTTADGVTISEAGQTAAEVARYIRESASESEIRQELVDSAKQNIEEGRHKVEEVLHAVVSALTNYL